MVNVIVDSGELPSMENASDSYERGRIIAKWQSIAAGRFQEDCRFLKQMIDETDRLELWKKPVGGFTYPTRDDFLRRKVLLDFELTEKDFREIMLLLKQGDEESVTAIFRDARLQQAAQTVEPIGEHGTNRYSRGVNSENHTSIRGTGNTSYLMAKLKRDHPDIAERAAAGEFKSAAQAWRVARGEPEPVKKVMIGLNPDDPFDAVERIRDRFGEDFLASVKEVLNNAQ